MSQRLRGTGKRQGMKFGNRVTTQEQREVKCKVQRAAFWFEFHASLLSPLPSRLSRGRIV